LVDAPAFTAQKNMNTPIAITDAGLANLFDALFKTGLSGATRLVVIGGRIDQEYATSAPDRNAPLATRLVNQLTLPDRPQSFRRIRS
jgi:hypothetical protein